MCDYRIDVCRSRQWIVLMWPYSRRCIWIVQGRDAFRVGEVFGSVFVVDMSLVAKRTRWEDRMSIQIPSDLQWVAYLLGDEWPEGDEDEMDRMGSDWHSSSEQVLALIPELNWTLSRTMEVLQGQTARAAEQQFNLLFRGNASVAKLAEAMRALGDLAVGTAKGIVHTKLQISTSYAIAAFEISYAEAQTAATLGSSEAEIPIIKEFTIAAIRQAITKCKNDILVDLGKTMTKTNVSRIAKKSAVKTAEGVGQDLFIQAVQDGSINWKETEKVALSNATGGAAQGAVSVVGKRMLKNVSMNRVLQGELIGYSSGLVKQVAGSVATGKKIDTVSLLGAPIKSAITGGIRGGGGARVTAAPESVSEGAE